MFQHGIHFTDTWLLLFGVSMTYLAAIQAYNPNSSSKEVISVKLDVRMPNIPAVEGINEIYLCTSVRLPEPDKTLFATRFDPKVSKNNVHHMVLYGISEAQILRNGDNNQAVWPCGFDPTNGTLYHPLAEKVSGQPGLPFKQTIIFTWGSQNESDQILPNGVGFKLGAETVHTSLMLLIHYKNLENNNDTTGVTVHLTSEKQQLLAGVLALGSKGSIPPHQTVAWESSCPIPLGFYLHPFSYRVHTHYIGKVVAGYIVDKTNSKWTLIGKKDPSLPQINEDQNDNLVVKGEDTLAVRCTFVSDRDTKTVYGPTEMNEMCVFLLMYYIDPANSNMPEDSWLKNCTFNSWRFQFENIPKDVSEIEGVRYEA